MRVEPWDSYPDKGRVQSSLPKAPSVRTPARRQLSANQKESPPQMLNLPASWFWNFQLPKLGERNVCCLSCPVSGICYGSLSWDRVRQEGVNVTSGGRESGGWGSKSLREAQLSGYLIPALRRGRSLPGKDLWVTGKESCERDREPQRACGERKVRGLKGRCSGEPVEIWARSALEQRGTDGQGAHRGQGKVHQREGEWCWEYEMSEKLEKYHLGLSV